MLSELKLRIAPQYCPEIEVRDLLLVLGHEVPPLLLSSLALHAILIQCLTNINLWELLLEVFIYLIVVLGELEGGAAFD